MPLPTWSRPSGRVAAAGALAALALITATPPARAQPRHEVVEAERIVGELVSGARLPRTLAAIAAHHLIGRQTRFHLFADRDPRWWQTILAPGIPHLVRMLGDASGLEWINPQTGETETTTTPRKEATLALVALERAAVAPLLAALGDPALAPHAAAVLRRILGGGPGDDTPAAWQRFWAEREGQPLPGERGRLLQVLAALVILGGGAALVVGRQRKAAR